jgi:hypothetical protein
MSQASGNETKSTCRGQPSSCGCTPALFVDFWGDRHRDLLLDPERAPRIDPARSALDRNLRITLQHDAPIAGIEMLKGGLGGREPGDDRRRGARRR